MSTEEIIAYLTSYVKACKIKGDPYVMAYMGLLYLVDDDLSTLYVITLEHSINSANRLSGITNGAMFDISVANLIVKVIESYRTLSVNDFKKLSRSDMVDYDIPSHASDNCKLTQYYFDDNPTESILVPEFYGMVPVNKSDIFEVYHKWSNEFSSILLYRIIKKKPKIEITMYRRILNLPRV